MAEQKMSVLVCDGCGKMVIVDDGPPQGFHGTVQSVEDTKALPWWACQPKCIRKAVELTLANPPAEEPF